MYKSKCPQRSLIFPIILLLLLSPLTVLSGTEDADDLEDIEELIAIDDEQESGESPQTTTHFESKDFSKKSEAEVLSKAQRIVPELNNDNTRRIIEENEYVLVLGYAPWCRISADLMPRFAEAANVLKGLGSGILLAKIDSQRYSKAASDLGIEWSPTLLLFVNGSSQPYTGGFPAEEIVLWARKKTGSPVIRIDSVDEANEFLKQHKTYAVGLFDKFVGRDYEEFVKAAEADNEFQFVETSRVEVAMVLYPPVNPTKPFFGLVRNEPEHYTTFDEESLTSERILRFLESHKFPLVSVLTHLNYAKVCSSLDKVKLKVYVFGEANELKKLLEPLQDVARRFKSKIMLVAVDIAVEDLGKPLLALFDLAESEETNVIALDNKSHSKYLLEADPTPRNIADFCSRLVKGTQSPYYKSQPIPDNKNASILTVVGKTFDDLVLNSPSNIFLEVNPSWCFIICETTSKQVEKLAKHFKGLDNLVFARIDSSTNEHPKLHPKLKCLQVQDYPMLLFYPANDKSNPITLPNKAGSKEWAALINKYLKSQDSLPKDEL